MRAFLLLALLVPLVTRAQIDPPELLYPGNGGWRFTDSVQEWAEVPGAIEYRIQIGLPDTEFTKLAAAAFVRGATVWEVSLPAGFYEWRAAASDGVTWSGWSDVWTFEARFQTGVEPSETIDESVSLGDIYPNPSASVVTIPVNGTGGEVDLRVFDLLGREVAVLYQGPLSGSRQWVWDATAVPSGVYVVWFCQGSRVVMQRVVVVR